MKVLYRLASHDGRPGWSRAWVINCYARLGDGRAVEHHLGRLLSLSTLPNLFCDHPPFQIDGNFGGCAGIAECLLQSHQGEIHLLPALPPTWTDGRVSDLRARGGITVDIDWASGRLTSFTLRSDSAGRVRVRSAWPLVESGAESIEGDSLVIELQAGLPVTVLARPQ